MISKTTLLLNYNNCSDCLNFQELNRKSQMVEEAVEEVLELVRKAAEVFKATHENDDFDFIADGNFEF